MGFKKKSISLFDGDYTTVRKIIKCPECSIWFDEPNGWHYCRCPMCDLYLWDDRQ